MASFRYYGGNGIDEADKVQAFKWFQLAAGSGSVFATVNIAAMVLNGEADGDAVEEFRSLKEVAHDGSPAAQSALAQVYADSRDVERYAPAEVAKWLFKAAEQSEATAAHKLAVAYLKGDSIVGVAKDDHEMIKWYRVAADGGNPNAAHSLGIFLTHGEVVEQDYQEAIKYFDHAIKYGNEAISGAAQCSLGAMHADGTGVPQDLPLALKLYTQSAERGCAQAHSNLAFMYESGNGVTLSMAQAIKWHTSGAKLGFATSQYSLASIYAQGKGVPQNFEAAFKWCKMAAEQGDDMAQHNLGLIYREGDGTARDYGKACAWLQKAMQQGYVFSPGVLMRLQDAGVLPALAEGTPVTVVCLTSASSVKYNNMKGTVVASLSRGGQSMSGRAAVLLHGGGTNPISFKLMNLSVE